MIDKTCVHPSFPAFTQKQVCLWSPYFLPRMGTRRFMQGYPWSKKQVRMGERQNMRPSSFLTFTQKQLGFQSPCFLPHMGPRRKMQGYLWRKKHARRMGKMQNMPPWLLLRVSCASSPLAFCPAQLHDGISGSVKSDQRHSALRPCLTQSKIGTGSNFQKSSPATSTI